MPVYSIHAQEAAEKKIHRIKQRLKDIEVMLGKYESLQRFHYGHDGNLGYILDLLDQVHLFMIESKD